MTVCMNSGCQGVQYSLSARLQEVGELKARLEGSEAQVRELQASLAVRTSSVELSRANDRLAAVQELDVIQRRGLDRAHEELTYMRQLMKTNGYDMEALYSMVGDHLAKTCGRAEAASVASS